MLASLIVGAAVAVGSFQVAWRISADFRLAWWAALAALIGALAAGQLLIVVREYTFAAATRTLTVRERWLGLIRRKPRFIPFADIAAVYLRSGESVQAVVVLRSGKKLYPRRPGTPREINRYCAAVKRITHVGRVLPAERRWRGRGAWRKRREGPTLLGEMFQHARSGVRPRCGATAGADGKRCPACRLRLR